MMNLGRKGFKTGTIVAIVILAVAAASCTWYYEAHSKSSSPAVQNSESVASSSPSSTAAANATSSGVRATVPKAATSNSGKANAAVATVQPSLNSGPVIDPASLTTNTNSWGTCKNVQYGYEVKYPSSWMMVEDGNNGWTADAQVNCANKQEVVFSANDPLIEKISIDVYPGTENVPGLNSTASVPGMSWQETTIDGEEALWNAVIDVNDKMRTDTVDIRHDGTLYVIQYWFSTATSYVNLNEIYFQTMAEKLKFL